MRQEKRKMQAQGSAERVAVPQRNRTPEQTVRFARAALLR